MMTHGHFPDSKLVRCNKAVCAVEIKPCMGVKTHLFFVTTREIA